MGKKILIVTDFYNPHKSGIVTYIDQMIGSIRENQDKVTVLTTLNDKKLSKIELTNQVEIIRCKPTIKLSRGFYSIELVIKFLTIYKKYNIVNLHLPLAEILPIIFFTNKNNTIINYHCLPYFKFHLKIISFYFYFFGLISIFRSKTVISLSLDYFNKIYFHKYFKNKINEIPPYIKEIKYLSKTKTENNILTLGYLGRISNEKGLEYLISASNILNKKNIDHNLIIAGDTSDLRFKKYINHLKKISNQNTNFVGNLSEKEKDEFYKKIDIFILPSINSFEAFGIVQLEAMSYGIPVIASDINGVKSIVQKTKNGYLFKNKNSKDLANKIVLCIEKKFENDLIKKNVISNYNKNLFSKNLKSLF